MFNSTNVAPIISGPASNQRNLGTEFARIKQKKQLLIILILLFVCVAAWAIVSIFSSQKKSALPPNLTKLAKALNPLVDTSVFDTLEAKRAFTDEELSQFTIYKIVTDPISQSEKVVSIDQLATPKPTTTPRPKSSATPLPTAL